MHESTVLLPSHLARPFGVERRRSERRPCSLLAMCWPLGDPCSTPSQVLIQNLSAGGIGLRASYRFDPGTYLFVELRRPNEDAARTFVVRVVYQRRSSKTGGWTIGCAFTNALGDDDVRALLTSHSTAQV